MPLLRFWRQWGDHDWGGGVVGLFLTAKVIWVWEKGAIVVIIIIVVIYCCCYFLFFCNGL